MDKRRVKEYLRYTWWHYAILIFLSVSFWITFMGIITSPKDNQQINVFVSTFSYDTDMMENELLSFLEDTDLPIRKVTIGQMDASVGSFDSLLGVKSMKGTDLVIIPANRMNENTASTYFFPIGSLKLRSLFGDDATLYMEDDIGYGVLISKANERKSRFSMGLHQADRQDYYLFFNAYSVNLGELNGRGNEEDDGALRSARWLHESWDDANGLGGSDAFLRWYELDFMIEKKLYWNDCFDA